jgi:rieske iron-sulfur protein
MLECGIGLGVGWCLAPSTALAQPQPAADQPREGDLLVRADGASQQPVTPDDVAPHGAPTIVWAMDPATKAVRSGSRLNSVLLLRFGAEELSADTRARAAGGIVAYTTICTHTGCEVSDWLADTQILSCPCHESAFDPKDGAKVVDGPAPRGLPALPLKIVDGNLVVAGPFTARVGF